LKILNVVHPLLESVLFGGNQPTLGANIFKIYLKKLKQIIFKPSHPPLFSQIGGGQVIPKPFRGGFCRLQGLFFIFNLTNLF